MINSHPHRAETGPAQGDPQPDRRVGCARCLGETDDERAARYGRMLRRLAEIGMNAAEALDLAIAAEAAEARRRLAAANPEADEAPPETTDPEPAAANPAGAKNLADAALTLARVGRCVRQTIMLDDRLIAEFRARAKAEAAEAVERAVAATAERRKRSRIEVDRVVKEAIRAEAGDRSEFDHLIRLLKTRMGENDIYEDLGRKPIEDIVVRLCRDLQLDPDWDRWQGEEWLSGRDRIAPETPLPPLRFCPSCCPVCNPPGRDPATAAADAGPAASLPDSAPPDPPLPPDPPSPPERSPTGADPP
jgi:hypothetical protein